MTAPVSPYGVDHAIDAALTEDLFRGDITTALLFPNPAPAQARVIAQTDLTVAGLWLLERVYHRVDAAVTVERLATEGARARAGEVLARLAGDGRALLAGERVALNFLQRLCGIATLTARFVEAVQGYPTRILDTRKTTPGLRALEKYAVRVGGGENHRADLGDAVLVKDNHLALLGSAPDAAARLRAAMRARPYLKNVAIEAKTEAEVDAALAAGADVILLDNMPPEQLRACVKRIGGRARTEASGGVTLATVRAIAATGVDAISIGALTHSAPAADLSLEIAPAAPGGTGGRRRRAPAGDPPTPV
jgi:nicotinate-nucleotide pyrophosphorylase (carboxylating)